jgi:2-polyprenyl-3-methyl-5-hydroxy-6-metoxy-1,4-benzoquinol methylase
MKKPLPPQEPPIEAKLAALMKLVNEQGHPNIGPLWQVVKDIEGIKFNLKLFGYELARKLCAARPPKNVPEPIKVGLASKPCTQEDMDADWLAHWAGRLGISVIYHRKIWEYCYLLQALHDRGLLKAGTRGLGFGCGQEPIPSFLASLGCDVTMTDLAPTAAAEKGWVATNQHTSSVDTGHHPHLVDRERFLEHVTLEYVDMNAIPATLRGYDFCWSLCCLEHLGSIRLGLDFIKNSMETLRPGGVAVHTTEFNFLNDAETLDNWATVLFQRRHLEAVAADLRAQGHKVARLDFNIGNEPMDRFIDLPPYDHDLTGAASRWANGSQHLKLMLDGFASTCFGLIVIKAPAGASP